jgi:hypothetical protein
MPGTGGFQTQATPQPAAAVAGDRASQNPIFTFDAGPFGLVSGSQATGISGLSGVVVGRFAWAYPPVDADGTPAVVQNSGYGPPSGLVPREQQALITLYLADASMIIAPGFEMTLMIGGDFWVVNDGSTQALPQAPGQAAMKAYANLTNGKISFAATGSPTTSGTSTASSIAGISSTFTGTISGDILSVTTAPSTSLVPGATLSGTAGGIVAGTQIVSQISGTTGGIGTYYVNTPEQSTTSQTVTATWGVLTVAGTVTGTFAVGDLLSGTGVAANTSITALGTGTGQAGTYIVNNNAAVSSSTINALGTVETKWYCMSSGLPGEIVKISSHPLG